MFMYLYMIRTSLYITEKHKEFLKKNCINLSAFVRQKINEYMEDDKDGH